MALAGVLALAGCGAGSGPDGTGPQAGPGGLGALASLVAAPASGTTSGSVPTSQSTPTSRTTATGSSGATSTGTPSTTQTSGATRTVTPRYLFATPSRNISCAIEEGPEVRCDIVSVVWSVATPTDCPVDYGHGVSLRAGRRAGLVCAGDTIAEPGAEILPYNASVQAGDLVCTSSQAGMRCQDVTTGHGFTLAKEAHTEF